MHPILGFLVEGFSPLHLLIIGFFGILLFGKRLPEIGRSLGKGIVEFKKGLKGLEDDPDAGLSSHTDANRGSLEPPAAPRPPLRVTTSVPKFEDNPGTPNPPPQV